MFQTIIQALLPVVFVIALGWVAAWRGWVKTDQAGVFAGFVVHFALPFALFLGVVKAEPSDLTNVPYLLTLAAGLAGTFLIGLAASAWVFRLPLRDAAVFALGCSFPNMAYFGVPVLTTAVGTQGLLAIVVGNLIVTVIILPLTVVLIETHGKSAANGGPHKSTGAIITAAVTSGCAQPLVWLPVLGLVLALLRVKLPPPLLDSFNQVGSAASGLALFTLGLMISAEKPRLNVRIVTALILKNIAQAALMLGAALLLKLRWPLSAEAVLIGVMPTASATAMFAQRYDAYREEAPTLVLISTLLAVVIVAAVLIALPLLPH